MKVSIVSLYGHFNYGNRLQSYAAQEILRNLGCDTTVIHVETRKTQVREIMKKVYFPPPVKALLRPSPSTVYKNRRQRNFERFTRENISEKAYYSVKAIEDADFFVLGSDQVWTPKRYNETKKQLFFLTFTEPRKKVCLSPSFGLSEIPEKWRAYFSEQLATFPNLWAREDSGAAIIRQLTGRDVPVFIDPTLMLDRDKWSAAARKPEKVRTDGGYILQYFLGGVTAKAAEDVAGITPTGKASCWASSISLQRDCSFWSICSAACRTNWMRFWAGGPSATMWPICWASPRCFSIRWSGWPESPKS